MQDSNLITTFCRCIKTTSDLLIHRKERIEHPITLLSFNTFTSKHDGIFLDTSFGWLSFLKLNQFGALNTRSCYSIRFLLFFLKKSRLIDFKTAWNEVKRPETSHQDGRNLWICIVLHTYVMRTLNLGRKISLFECLN